MSQIIDTYRLVDFFISLIILILLAIFLSGTISWKILFLPAWIVFGVVSAFSIGLWLASLSALYRDIKHSVPLLFRVWMYVTPVLYSQELVSDKSWLSIIYWLNPPAVMVQGFRWSFIDSTLPPYWAIATSIVLLLVLLISGLFYFNYVEKTFVDHL
ncbi:MAG: ABC transporter permease [Anaerolineaceae bacterium]|nr:ABC transporter permease [Anaerolineaceae bacterium]